MKIFKRIILTKKEKKMTIQVKKYKENMNKIQ